MIRFDAIPFVYKLGAVAMMFAALAIWHQAEKAQSAREAVAEFQREYDKAAIKNLEGIRNKERDAATSIETLQKEVFNANEIRKSDSKRYAADLERLRQYAGASPSAASATASAAGRTNDSCGPELHLSKNLADVAGRLAERADALEAQVVGLQEYAKTAQKLCGGHVD